MRPNKFGPRGIAGRLQRASSIPVKLTTPMIKYSRNPDDGNSKNSSAVDPIATGLSANRRAWYGYILNLCWEKGHLDESSWHAALRAASLNSAEDHVFEVLSTLIEKAGDEPKPEKIRSQIERARSFVMSRQGDCHASTAHPTGINIGHATHSV